MEPNDEGISELLEWMKTLEHLKEAHDVDLSGIAGWQDPQGEAARLVAEHCTDSCEEDSP